MFYLTDSFRIRHFTSQWSGEGLWRLEAWEPSMYDREGTWKPVTGRLRTDRMMAYLRDLPIPGDDLVRFAGESKVLGNTS